MDFEVVRSDLTSTRVVDLGEPELADGQALLRIDQFGLTANNITYGVFGDALQYWSFFPPSSDDGWGRLPVFGFADVAASTHPDVEPGLRVFGYFPMSTTLVVRPERVDERGFVDGAEHRRAMAAAYNHYLRVDSDPGYGANREAQQMLLRPLFITSFLIEDFLFDNAGFGATTVLVSSASSKTALGTAFQLSQRTGAHVIGLTSEANREFVDSVGVYDRVATYDEVDRLPAGPAVYVDVSGSGALRQAIHDHVELTYDMAVGATHWDEGGAPVDLTGPSPTLFFAPTQLGKRTAEWGQDGFDERFGLAWHRFSAWADRWLEAHHGFGPDAVERAYQTLLQGGVDPRVGHVLSMRSTD